MSYGLYVGKQCTRDGIAWLAGYGDEPSSHWLEIVPAVTPEPGSMLTVGVTPEAKMPGRLSEIPRAAHEFRHLRVSYSHYRGVPAPLTNGGLNEHGVAVRDIWSTSRAELIAMTPPDQTGPNYSDLAREVLKRARTAREGVDLIGRLIADHGYSTYGGNSHLIADHNEAWVVIEMAGGRRLWCAERLGPASIRASRPGHIGVIPETTNETFRFPSHFISEAIALGWHRSGETFNVNSVYGDGKGVWAGAAWIEEEMKARAERSGGLTFADMAWAIRTSKLTGDTTGYGQIVKLRDPASGLPPLLWHAAAGAVSAPFMPVWMTMETIPAEYRRHRYLGEEESARFLDQRHHRQGQPGTVSHVAQGTEAMPSVVERAKRLFYLALRGGPDRLDRLADLFAAFEARTLAEVDAFEEATRLLVAQGRRDLAAVLLNTFSAARLGEGARQVEALVAGLEAEIRALGRDDEDPVPLAPEQIW